MREQEWEKVKKEGDIKQEWTIGLHDLIISLWLYFLFIDIALSYSAMRYDFIIEELARERR